MTARARHYPLWRVLLVLIVTLAVCTLTWIVTSPPYYRSDFQFLWYADRLWSLGTDPYSARPRAVWWSVWPLWDRLFYPLPALIVVAPFVQLPLRAAHVAFITVATLLLAWRLSRDALWPLLLFATPGFVIAAFLGQWSPWLMFAMLVPNAGFVFACKPTLGLACFCFRPTWRAVASGSAIVGLSVVLMPAWPLAWLDNLTSVASHPAPITELPFGALLTLAALRWRTPEGRLLLAMAFVPQLLLFADQLPLFLTARSRREAMFLVVANALVVLIWLGPAWHAAGVLFLSAHYVLLGCYMPALWLVMRRPNRGPAPAWLERVTADLPQWIRGDAQ